MNDGDNRQLGDAHFLSLSVAHLLNLCDDMLRISQIPSSRLILAREHTTEILGPFSFSSCGGHEGGSFISFSLSMLHRSLACLSA